MFDGVIGHDRVTDLLADEALHPAQAYLFVGPTGVGKATVARRFAALLICPDRAAGCVERVLGGTHPDLILVEPDGRTALTVDQARATVARAVLSPVEADRKVFLFEEAGMMNDEAANALLKTLEEPTVTTIFILVTESEDDLPPTVASRCRTVRFGRVGEESLAAALGTTLALDEDQAGQVARISGGRPGLAMSLATRPEVTHYRRIWLGIPTRLSPRPGDAFRLAEEVVEAAAPLLEAIRVRHAAEEETGSTRDMRERRERELKRETIALHVAGLEILASWYRDAAAAQLGAPARNADVPPAVFTTLTPTRAMVAAGRVLDTVEALRANQRPELAFAALFSDLSED